mmetsp:Transcript_18148/g.39629  ORF Transcript_18148/g.39629 Transcript_18148/m.39629 type:complete len:86 (+) Transcript_18148:486-743(+)
MESRTLEALALRPTGNTQGGHYFLNLSTGRVITRYQWTALPMPTRIKKLVSRSARRYPANLEVLDGRGHEVVLLDEDDEEESSTG